MPSLRGKSSEAKPERPQLRVSLESQVPRVKAESGDAQARDLSRKVRSDNSSEGKSKVSRGKSETEGSTSRDPGNLQIAQPAARSATCASYIGELVTSHGHAGQSFSKEPDACGPVSSQYDVDEPVTQEPTTSQSISS